ncbi:PLATZ transcription factor family protein, partial [Trifolium medium]|nr:PLATZ transcription factor family protein [Trifolium medium]
MEEMERLLEESIKVSPQKEKAKRSREQNLKRKVDEAGIDEQNEDGEEKEDNNKEEKDNKESALLVNRPSASF